MVDGFLVLANAMLSSFKVGNLTEINDIKCYTLNFTPWDSGTTVRQKALEVSIKFLVCDFCNHDL